MRTGWLRGRKRSLAGCYTRRVLLLLIVGGIALCVASIWAAVTIGGAKNRHLAGWLLGILLGPVGAVLMYLVPARPETAAERARREAKQARREAKQARREEQWAVRVRREELWREEQAAAAKEDGRRYEE